jgi:hypothetical protein
MYILSIPVKPEYLYLRGKKDIATTSDDSIGKAEEGKKSVSIFYPPPQSQQITETIRAKR